MKDVDEIFFIKDFILQTRFVSPAFSRQVCGRITDLYYSWLNFLHGLLVPQPYYMVSQEESKFIDDNDRKKIHEFIREIMALTSTNRIAGLSKDKALEAKFIDESVNFWNKKLRDEMIYLMKKLDLGWRQTKFEE